MWRHGHHYFQSQTSLQYPPWHLISSFAWPHNLENALNSSPAFIVEPRDTPDSSVATAVPIYRHSPYRDHLPNFGPYLVPIIQSILHDLKLRVHQKVTVLSDLMQNWKLATFLQLGPYFWPFGPY